MTLLDTDRELTRLSYYAATSAREQVFAPLQGEQTCDVAVVGGGLAGLSAALELRQRGFDVALLEAREIGFGASGRNGGQAIHGLACELQLIEWQLGLADARRVWEMSIEALRLLIQQSNCLVIVDRGISEAASDDEKRRTRSPNSEVRDDANMGQGQEVAADFVLRSVVLKVGTDKSSSFNLGAIVPWKAAGALSVGQTISSADVQLVLSDVRSKIQLAVAQGQGSDSNTGLATSVIGGAGGLFGGGGAKTQSNSPNSKILLQAFADAYNKMIPALKNYKAQMVKGGLGAGGTLKVQGSKVDPSAVQK